jgi:nicotinate-nucleotide adenylyltransferase
MKSGSTITVFGGTFDPPHVGHLIVASDVCDLLGVERVLFVPAALPPHKLNEVTTPAESRLRMVELAVADDRRFEASDMEISRGGPSFTIDTVRELKSGGYGKVFVLVGADGLSEMRTWKEYKALLTEAYLIVMSRPGFDPAPVRYPDLGTIPYLDVTPIGVSSTMVRERVVEGRSIKYLVPERVEEFIYKEGLYVESR